jgi:hypothetical protein
MNNAQAKKLNFNHIKFTTFQFIQINYPKKKKSILTLSVSLRHLFPFIRFILLHPSPLHTHPPQPLPPHRFSLFRKLSLFAPILEKSSYPIREDQSGIDQHRPLLATCLIV